MTLRPRRHVVALALVMAIACTWDGAVAFAADKPAGPTPGDRMIAAYFASETKRIAEASLADVRSKDDWLARRGEARRELLEMLGLDPLPDRTDLKPAVTGTIDHPEFTVENLHYQSRPGLYVTGNLYVPKNLTGPAPAILYVCGHGAVKRDGVSYGNKVYYHQHGAWFARNGYVCLVIDSLQLGEIEGIHHGTYNQHLWWWNSRGYTPAGVEAWNCVRALDFLLTRKEVDPKKLGVTGRSGGGAYSWWVTALDDRIAASAPTAGITDLHNHVVDGTVEGHCDCMFMINTYRWDFAQVAALAVPRPLLIVNTDKDSIFPLDGVLRTYWQTRRLYDYFEAPKHVGPVITEGGHVDTQEQQVAIMAWFNRHLKGREALIENEAVKMFEPEQLRVFKELPADAINGKVHETFVPQAGAPEVPKSAEAWAALRDGWMAALRDKVFRGWPAGAAPPPEVREVFAGEHSGLTLKAFDFASQHDVTLRLYVLHRTGLADAERLVLNVLDDQGWTEFLATTHQRPAFDTLFKEEGVQPWAGEFERGNRPRVEENWVYAWVAPRGVGLTAFDPDPFEQDQVRRRFVLLGQTLESTQAWDVRRAVHALRAIDGPTRTAPTIRLAGHRQAAGLALYASLFEPGVTELELTDLPGTHRDGPHFLNVMRFLDVPQALAMAAERSRVRLIGGGGGGVERFAKATAAALGWPAGRIDRLDVEVN
jgi:dienelactone hydrolase